MPQKIDIHGLFIDPETITDLRLQKRISVYYPVFYEIETARPIFGRFSSPQKHVLRFDHQQPYGIILADPEQPDPSSYVVNYKEAALERFLKGIGQTGKSLAGHISECFKIEISGDRRYRILQSGRNVKQTTIREIPAKIRLLSGQWVDIFKSSPEYDFQGGTPYAVTDVGSSALMIEPQGRIYVLYGASVDASDDEVITSYRALANVYNQIQEKRDGALQAHKNRPPLQLPQINIQLPKVDLPKIDIPPIRFQSPFVLGQKREAPDGKATEEPIKDSPSDVK